MDTQEPYVTIRSRGVGNETTSSSANQARSATHDTSRTSFHVKHISQFARRVEESAARAFPNRGRTSQRYSKVQSLLLHWGTDDLFVLPELEDLEKCFREDYAFGTDIWAIPSENAHLELMMRLGQLIKEHESPETLFIVYYGGHARIDESRQSTWCATRDSDSPWLQWSAIQTLLERSKSDVLILLDCCAGAASATFPTGNSITETISASSWDAIAPDPGRYSFTNALIEVMTEWRHRAFSAAMLHAEVLARLKHPRPITINGKLFEARSTPVHFMMTSNHKAPSIELSRVAPESKAMAGPTAVTPSDSYSGFQTRDASSSREVSLAEAPRNGLGSNEPNEDTPHVMISVALEEDQRLDINAWEQWLGAFPALAKYVKVQGVFKSHSTLLLVSMPVMVWDLLPEDHATSFVAFIRSNNLASHRATLSPAMMTVPVREEQHEAAGQDTESFFSRVSGTTVAPTVDASITDRFGTVGRQHAATGDRRYLRGYTGNAQPELGPGAASSSSGTFNQGTMRSVPSAASLPVLQGQGSPLSAEPDISHRMIFNQQQLQRRTTFGANIPEPKKFAPHVEKRLEEYYQYEQLPNDAQKAFFASNLGVEPWHVEVWFHHRRERDMVANRLATMELKDVTHHVGNGPRMILPADLDELLSISSPYQTILFDLRTRQHFQRSHIYGAVNLRTPQSFLHSAPIDMIQRAIPDEEGQQTFSRWRSARCIVFYGKGLEHPRDCPAAGIIFEKLQESAWFGRCFVLKGHYREFSVTFDKYIVGTKMTTEAETWIAQHRQAEATPFYHAENQERYASWLSHVETEERLRPQSDSPTKRSEAAEALLQQEQELEAEFRANNSELYMKVRESHFHSSDEVDMKAQIVEHLDRGLTKMREAQAPPPAFVPTYEPGHSKLADEGLPSVSRDIDDYVEVGPATDVTAGSAPRGRSQHRMEANEVEQPGRGRASILHKVFRRS
ncbi:hypothetical protein NLU13_6097 [Sarocladium strictum]|uniref:Homeobox domain-containing protein n=1 Tax=Sarocladium strictum TaxID=5046 RepID=A0AA39GF92_SARSR|nr:hypothetical protein NLU13_6097 [Sarocladium strictum]